MDFKFSEEQKMFRSSVQDFLKKECPMSLVREIEEQKSDYSRELYRKMAGLGWLGIMIPEEYGGTEGDWVDMAILYEEAGRVLMQSPHLSTAVLGGQTILALGTEEQKEELLPKIVDGEITLALAITEPEAASNLALLTASAEPQDGNFVINGNKLFVGNGHNADFIITVVKTKIGTKKGVSLFLVDGKNPGLSFIPMETMGGNILDDVTYNKVVVPKDKLLGKSGNGDIIADIVDKAQIMTCAEMVGSAGVALEMSIDYSKDRVQFDQPIGSFQAIQHKIAKMSESLEGAKWLTYYTAWLSAQGVPCAKEIAMTKLYVGEACRIITAEAEQIHGGMGIMWEHDLTFYFRRVKAGQLSLGYPYTFQETIAQSLGL